VQGVYSTHYPRFRYHGQRSIAWEVIERAITNHLNTPYSSNVISFYGGEPLIEFELLKRTVLFAEEHSRKHNKKYRLSL
jgi:uncharacterized protein